MRAVFQVDALVSEALDVVDISAGGLALARGPHAFEPGSRVALTLTLTGDATRRVTTIARWQSAQVVGLELVEVDDDTRRALDRYLAELLERGQSV